MFNTQRGVVKGAQSMGVETGLETQKSCWLLTFTEAVMSTGRRDGFSSDRDSISCVVRCSSVLCHVDTSLEGKPPVQWVPGGTRRM